MIKYSLGLFIGSRSNCIEEISASPDHMENVELLEEAAGTSMLRAAGRTKREGFQDPGLIGEGREKNN